MTNRKHNKPKPFTLKEQEDILALFRSGKTSREICRQLGWSEGRKSSVNYYLKPYRDVGLNELDVNHVSDEQIKSVLKFGASLAMGVEKEPKILYFDIETSPAVSAHWKQWDENIPHVANIRPSHMLSHAWSWGDGEVKGSVLTHTEAKEADDERLVLEMWSLFDKADVLIAHNGKNFDIKKVNASFLKYNMNPPSPYKVIDTLAIARKKFNLPFKNLDFLCQYLNVPYQKVKHEGMGLWVRCLNGDVEALSEMKHYNLGDIHTLRSVYKRLSVWDNNSVNLNAISEDRYNCPTCNSGDVMKTENFVYTNTKGYSVWKCRCGALCKEVGKGLSLV